VRSSRGPVLRRIAVLGNYGNLNLGDEATLQSVRQIVSQRCPGAVVCALSEHPEETRRRHGIEAAPSVTDARNGPESGDSAVPGHVSRAGWVGLRGRLKADLKQMPALFAALRAAVNTLRMLRELGRQLRFGGTCFAFLRGVDLLVVAGGGQLSDHFDGVWGFPLQLFSWCLLARCAGAQVAVLNVGAGPIRGPASRVLFRWTLKLAKYRSYRDERSRRLIESIGVRDAGSVGPDLVFGWEPSGEPGEATPTAGRTVGLNVFPYNDRRYWPMSNSAAYAVYIEKIGDLTLWLLAEGYRVRLFPTQLRADPRVIRDVLEKLKPRLTVDHEARLEVVSIGTVQDLAREIRHANVIVATRFHAIVIAMLMGKPVLGLCNESKMSDLMADMGLGAYSLLLQDFDVPRTIARFVDLEANRESVTTQLTDQVRRARQTLDRQLEAVFGPRATGPAVGATPAGSPTERATAPRLDALTRHGLP
jgi:polysaccharide pyruvyl transferase WcaK-like protein